MTKTKSELQTLARSAKRGFERTQKGRTDFIAGTLELAAAFCRARNGLPSDQGFHAWIEQASLRIISKDDRAALIFIGRHAKAARHFFMQNEDRWSWRLCADHLRMSGPVSQPATPVASPAKTLAVDVTYQTRRIVSPYTVLAPETKPSNAPLKLLTSERDQRECMRPPRPGETQGPHGAVAAVQAVVEVSSLSPSTVALHWSFERGEQPTPDKIREAAHWLELLADALEAETLRKPQHH